MSVEVPEGINPLNEDGTPKTAKQIEKEVKKKAKDDKFKEKMAKMAAKATVDGGAKTAAKKKPAAPKEIKKVVTYDIATPEGNKKDVEGELPSQYSPAYVEAAWYSWWKKEGFFKPEYNRDLSKVNPKGQFVMVIPPPNVTGSLHLGHALTNSVEDAIVRWHRMKGCTTLWVPGCDHAGIATQVVVEKKLKREENKTRHDIGREEFVKRVWQWKEEKGSRIYSQLERMGSSLDWDRSCFTMDSGPQAAVQECFLRLYEEGDIYRANRLVNWSCTLKSAISDIEVEKVELPGPTELSVPGYPKKVQFGVLIEFAYPVEGTDERLVVATTRIETMLGDTAVAVHPQDERYTHLHGKQVRHPITGKLLPIIADSFVEREFGTGAVKITPAHDPNDYEVGKRHSLPFINIFTDEGFILQGYGEFSGQHRFECRTTLTEKLKQLGFYVGTKDNPMVVPICSRSKDIIEPLLKPQWYVRMKDMAAEAVRVVEEGELELIPKMHEKTWYHWMKDIRDWCISRQLWWGHRIPAYFVTIKGRGPPTDEAEMWVCARSKEEALAKAVAKFSVPAADITLEQDPDVLDTWFSSALFPFATMGWPNKTKDVELFYPGALLETGHDILFFWVARMVFFGQKIMGCLPFKQVYLHAMVRDSHGRKMSKSLGNVIDPMDVINGVTLEELHKQLEANSNLDPREIEKAKAGQKADYPAGIPECGTDALRFALCAYTSQGRDINLDVLRVNGYRNFCNKLWNATKFALNGLTKDFVPKPAADLYKKQHSAILSNTQLLERYLEDKSYLCGAHPSAIDFTVYQALGTVDVKYPNLLRWHTHIGSFGEEERKEWNRNGALPQEISFCESPLRVVDRWMLHQVAKAVLACNEGFSTFNFPQATTGLYSLWWYDICDTYLECIKHRLYGTDCADAEDAKQVLFNSIETGLLLISPFMPFLSEELYQRLPLTPSCGKAESIAVAPYPDVEQFRVFLDFGVEEDFNFAQKIISEVRSAKSKYDVPSKTKINLFLQTFSDEGSRRLEGILKEVESLANAKEATVVRGDKPPQGCVPTPVSSDCVAWMKLEGLVDLSKCEERIQKKLTESEKRLTALNAEMTKGHYADKVPEDIKAKNIEKLKELECEIEQNKDALTQLAKMSSN